MRLHTYMHTYIHTYNANASIICIKIRCVMRSFKMSAGTLYARVRMFIIWKFQATYR